MEWFMNRWLMMEDGSMMLDSWWLTLSIRGFDWLSQSGITLAVESHKQPMLDESIEHKNHSSILKTDFYSKTLFDKNKQTEYYFLRIKRWI